MTTLPKQLLLPELAKIKDGPTKDFLKALLNTLQSQHKNIRKDFEVDEGKFIRKNGSVDFTGEQSMGDNKLTSVAACTAGGDAANKTYADARETAANTYTNTAVSGSIKSDGSVDFAADQSMGTNKLTDLKAPTDDNDAARKTDVETDIETAIPVALRVKGLCVFDGTGTPSIKLSYNVSGSITDNGTGDYTITWDTNFADTNYCVIGTCGVTDYRLRVGIQAIATGSVDIRVTNDAGGLADASHICVMAWGTQ